MSNKIRFIGNYDVNARGKFLWEILCQLRHLGKGRLLTKNEWARKWPKQPSYLRVVKVVFLLVYLFHSEYQDRIIQMIDR